MGNFPSDLPEGPKFYLGGFTSQHSNQREDFTYIRVVSSVEGAPLRRRDLSPKFYDPTPSGSGGGLLFCPVSSRLTSPLWGFNLGS